MSMTIDLEFPIERAIEMFGERGNITTFSVGSTCKSVDREGGGVWIQVDSHHRFWVPDHKVKGMHEQRSTQAKELAAHLPEYAEATDTGWKCVTCKREFASLQALKTHHGMAHKET